MPKYFLVVALTLLASFGGAYLAITLRKDTQPTLPSRENIQEPVPEFEFTERSGKTISNPDLKGKVWLASFVFTRCTGTCPAVASTLSRLQTELSDLQDFRIVTFTIDPDRDTPDELKKYAEHHRADADRWLFLTGSEKTIHNLATNGFHVLAKRRPDGKPGDEFDHSTYIVLVDKHGNIRDYFSGIAPKTGDGRDFEENLERLQTMARQLASE